MIIFDVRIFAVKKENYLRTIYNDICPGLDSIKEDTLLNRNDQGVSYGLDDTIINDSDFKNMKKTGTSSNSEE